MQDVLVSSIKPETEYSQARPSDPPVAWLETFQGKAENVVPSQILHVRLWRGLPREGYNLEIHPSFHCHSAPAGASYARTNYPAM